MDILKTYTNQSIANSKVTFCSGTSTDERTMTSKTRAAEGMGAPENDDCGSKVFFFSIVHFKSVHSIWWNVGEENSWKFWEMNTFNLNKF